MRSSLALYLMLLMGVLAAAQEPADVTESFRSAATQLDRLRHSGGADPDAVRGLVEPLVERMEQARADLEADSQAAAALMYREADLLRQAAALAGEPWREQALRRYAQLRVAHRDKSAGLLAYVGEARLLRETGAPEQALATLQPLLALLEEQTQPSATMRSIWRMAILERLETLVLSHDASAAQELAQQLRSFLFQEDQAAQAQLQWLSTRFDVQEALTRGDERAVRQAAAQIVRQLGGKSPDYEHLAALARLDAAASGAMPAEFMLQWARWLAALGRSEAMTAYQTAEARGAALLAEDVVAMAGLELQAGRLAEADHRLTALLTLLDEAAAVWPDALQRLAMARLALAQAPEAPPDAAKRALDALWRVAEAQAMPLPRRRWAINQWAVTAAPRFSAEQLAKRLQDLPDVVDGSAAARMLRAVATWQMMQRSRPAPEEASATAEGVTEELAAAEQMAETAGESDLAWTSRQWRCRVLAAWPMHQPEKAMQLLMHAGEDRLTTSDGATLRLRLLLEMGLVEEADSAWSTSAEMSIEPAATLELAAALAERHATAGENARDQLQQRVIELVNYAASRLAGGSDDRSRLLLQASEALLAVDALADAQRLVQGLEQGSVGPDEAERAALIRAAASHRRGGLDEAMNVLEQAVAEHPHSAALYERLGTYRQEAGDISGAAEALRQAREMAPAGSDSWWQATVGLVQLLRDHDQEEHARKVLRTSVMLYRGPDDPATRRQLRAMQQAMLGDESFLETAR